MSEELKSCPFCGETPAIHKLDDGVSIACYHDEDNKISVDDGCIHRVFIAGSNEIDAISAWNTRHESDTLPQWAKNKLFEKLDELRDTADNPFVVMPIRNAAKAQIDVIEWVFSLRNRGTE